MIMHQALKHPFGQIRQLEWSPDETRLLIRVSGGIELWEIRQVRNPLKYLDPAKLVAQDKLQNRQREWLGKIIKKLQWRSESAFLALTEDGLIQFVRNPLQGFDWAYALLIDNRS